MYQKGKKKKKALVHQWNTAIHKYFQEQLKTIRTKGSSFTWSGSKEDTREEIQWGNKKQAVKKTTKEQTDTYLSTMVPAQHLIV